MNATETKTQAEGYRDLMWSRNWDALQNPPGNTRHPQEEGVIGCAYPADGIKIGVKWCIKWQLMAINLTKHIVSTLTSKDYGDCNQNKITWENVQKVGLYGIFVFVAKCRLLKSTLPFGFFWSSTLLPGIVCACALQFFFLGCLWLWLGIAFDRFFTESSCEIIRRLSNEITTNFNLNIKYISYLNLNFIIGIIIILLLLSIIL